MADFPDRQWLDAAVDAVNDDDQFDRYARAFDATIRVDFGERKYALTVDDGEITTVHDDPTFVAWDVALRAPEATWRKLLSPTPPPRHNDLLGAWLRGDLDLEGDLKEAIQHVRPLKRMIDVFREMGTETGGSVAEQGTIDVGAPAADEHEHGEIEPVTGQYVWLDVDGESYRTYYEEAGDGDVPLVLLHTAGADARQYRNLLTDPDVLERFTVYAFDMPWHGKSFPPMDAQWWTADYRLTTDFYATFVMRFVDALGLHRPAVLGCSMGGAIVLELANSYAESLRAVIGLESTAFAPPRDIGYLDHPHVNGDVARPEWVYGLQAPQSPERHRRESWWMYSQAGQGVYVGDLHFYATDWDVRDDVADIDTDECPVYLRTGEYDYSAAPEDTRRVAERIDGADFEVMEELGHFPMVENPTRFKTYLDPILDEIANADGRAGEGPE